MQGNSKIVHRTSTNGYKMYLHRISFYNDTFLSQNILSCLLISQTKIYLKCLFNMVSANRILPGHRAPELQLGSNGERDFNLRHTLKSIESFLILVFYRGHNSD